MKLKLFLSLSVLFLLYNNPLFAHGSVRKRVYGHMYEHENNSTEAKQYFVEVKKFTNKHAAKAFQAKLQKQFPQSHTRIYITAFYKDRLYIVQLGPYYTYSKVQKVKNSLKRLYPIAQIQSYYKPTRVISIAKKPIILKEPLENIQQYLALKDTLLTQTTVRLRDAVQHAIKYNPDINFREANRQAWHESVAQAQADFFPTINVDAGYGNERAVNPVEQSLTGTSKSDLMRSEFGVEVTENVFDGFNTVHNVARTQSETAAAAYEIRGTANDLALDVAEQYISILEEKKLVQLARENLKEHRSIGQMIRDRKEAGVAKEAEVFQAQTRIALAENNLITQEANLEDMETKYSRFVRASAPKRLVMVGVPKYPLIPKTKRRALDIAIEQHPTLIAAQYDIKAAVAQHDASEFTNYPKIDVVYDVDRSNNINGIKGKNYANLFMIRANYNLFKGGAHVAKQRETAYQIQEAISVRNRTILQVEEAVNLAWTAMVQERKRMGKLRRYSQDASKTLGAYKEQFKLDQRTLLDVLDAQNEYFQAGVEYQKARFAEIFARYRLLNAMGKLLGYLKISLPYTAQLPEAPKLPGIHLD